MEQTSRQAKSLYDASVGEVAVKNFFAGFMHGLGGFFVTMISWVILYFLIIKIVVPQLQGLLDQAEGLMKLIPNNSGASQQIQIPENLMQQIEKLQQNK